MKPDRIRAIMREHKLTCRQTAFLVGVHPRTMESYIQGRRRMPERVELAMEAIQKVEVD